MTSLLLDEARRAAQATEAIVSDDLAMKQLVHTQVILAMDEVGLLDVATFQGGSSIANCYGGIRLSEDLDFVVNEFPDAAQADALAQAIRRRLSEHYGVPATVKVPSRERLAGDEARVPMQRFRIKVPYAKDRPDIPWLYVKIELARVGRSTSVPREAAPRISSFDTAELKPIVLVEEAVELVADKVISFAATTAWVRTRDLFDINWLLTREHIDKERLRGLVGEKLVDYGLDRGKLVTNLEAYRERLYGPEASVEAMDAVAPMLVDAAQAQRLGTARGAMAVVGMALDVCAFALV